MIQNDIQKLHETQLHSYACTFYIPALLAHAMAPPQAWNSKYVSAKYQKPFKFLTTDAFESCENQRF